MKAVRISLGTFSLEGAYYSPGKWGKGAVVLCHPHPQFGGTMDNGIINAIERELERNGWAVLKFNFRGVGGSGGEYAGGGAEVQDVLAAVDYLRGQEGDRAEPLYVIGYSFGAAVGLMACLRNTEIAGFIGVALPVSMLPQTSDVKGFSRGFYLIVGNRDSFVPLARVQEVYQLATGAKNLEVMADCDHFFFGLEKEVAAKVVEFLEKDSTIKR